MCTPLWSRGGWWAFRLARARPATEVVSQGIAGRRPRSAPGASPLPGPAATGEACVRRWWAHPPIGAPAGPRRASSGALREELERPARLRRLLAREVDAVPAEEGSRLRRGAEGVGRLALGRELEDARAIGIQPELRDEPPTEGLRSELELEDQDRPEQGQVVEADPFGRVPVEEVALLL